MGPFSNIGNQNVFLAFRRLLDLSQGHVFSHRVEWSQHNDFKAVVSEDKTHFPKSVKARVKSQEI